MRIVFDTIGRYRGPKKAGVGGWVVSNLFSTGLLLVSDDDPFLREFLQDYDPPQKIPGSWMKMGDGGILLSEA